MLTKLLEYEFKSTGRIVLPIAGGVLALNFVSDLLGLFVNNTSRTIPFVGVLTILLTVISFLGILAVFAVCLFVSIQRYYKLLGDQGYLLLALPVHAWQHIAAKLICGVVWTLFGLFYFQLSSLFKLSALEDDVGISFTMPDSKYIPLYLVLVLLVLALIAGTQLHAYLSCAFAGQFTHQRLLISICSYFVLGFLGQMLFLGCAVIFAVKSYPYADNISSFFSQNNGLMVSLCIACLAVLLVDALLWALTQWFMTKRLNLA